VTQTPLADGVILIQVKNTNRPCQTLLADGVICWHEHEPVRKRIRSDRPWLPEPTLSNDLLADDRNLKGIQIWPVAVAPILDRLAGCVVCRAIHRQ